MTRADLRARCRLAIGAIASNQGLTLIEALVAISVVGISSIMVVPPLFLAAATRVQNRRAEEALQIAQAEVDRVRTLVEQGSQSIMDNLPPRADEDDLVDVPAPGTIHGQVRSSAACGAYTGDVLANALTALPIDTDGDCATAEYYLQSFRNDGAIFIGGSDELPDFRMGVRVYSRSAADGNGFNANLESPPTQASLKYSSGEGNQRVRPLAVLYSNISVSNTDTSICSFHQDVCNTP